MTNVTGSMNIPLFEIIVVVLLPVVTRQQRPFAHWAGIFCSNLSL